MKKRKKRGKKMYNEKLMNMLANGTNMKELIDFLAETWHDAENYGRFHDTRNRNYTHYEDIAIVEYRDGTNRIKFRFTSMTFMAIKTGRKYNDIKLQVE